jgi:hypothetical protein
MGIDSKGSPKLVTFIEPRFVENLEPSAQAVVYRLLASFWKDMAIKAGKKGPHNNTTVH